MTSSETPKISVVIYSYNFERFLKESIESILAQTLLPYEILICDDHSTDKSWDIICKYSENYPELIKSYRHKKNIGMTANGNFGFKKIKGGLISWLDGDDRWLPTKLELEWKALRNYPGAKIAYSNVYIIDYHGNRQRIWDDGKYPAPPIGDAFVQIFSRRFFPNSTSVFRNHLMYRSVFDEIGYLDENLEIYIDWDFKIKATAKYPIVYSGVPLVEYRVHKQGISNSPREVLYRDMIRVYEKNIHLANSRSWNEIETIKNGVEQELKKIIPGETTKLKVPAFGKNIEIVNHLYKPYQPVKIIEEHEKSKSKLTPNIRVGENLIFLISQPRAGSTLLQRILNGHSDIHTTAEPWIMLHPIYALKRNGLDAEYESSLARQGLDDFLMQVPEGEELYIEALREMANVLYNKMINVSGKKYFLDKTPRYYFIIPELYRVFPKAKFIFLMRNPVAVLSSVLKTWCGNILQNLVNKPIHTDLIKGPHYLLQGIKGLKEDAIVVHYEKLVQNPKAVMQHVCKRIGIPFYDNMLEYGLHSPPEGRFGDSTGIYQHSKPVSEYIDKWTENLQSPDLIEFAQKYLLDLGPEVITRMGYSYQNIKDKLEPEKLFYRKSRGGIEESSELNQQGEDLFAKDNFDGALDAFTKALDIDQNNATTHNNLGVLYYNRGDKEKAFSHYKKAAELQPENITFQKNLADFYYVELGRVEEAMQIYVKVLNANPEDVETLLIIGHICVALKKFDDAKDFYSRILIIEPWNKDAKQFLEELEKCQLSVASDRLGSEDIETTPKECLVSAIVSTYNSERFIRGCLEDLENQTIADRLEIIVVNSGSEHNEDKIIKEFQEKYSNIKYIKTYQRETIYQAWNRGVKAATGKYITNANTDDRHRKDAFELLAKVLDENQDVALVYADQIITEKENETLEKYTQAGIFFWPDFDRNYLLKVCSTGSQPMWRKSVHEEFGYFDESMHIAGDYEFWLRITQKYFLKHVPELLGLYYRSSQNAEYRNHQRTMQETALVQSYYKTKLMLNEPQVQGNPLVSVIIPTYNRSQQLETALKSVALQSYENIEAIVINDGGEDVSVVIGKFKGELEIQYITHKQNKDRAAARNTGLKNARGEYIAYLDDDDIFHNDHIETALRVLTNSGFKIVYSDAFRTHQKNIDGNYQIIRKDIPYSTDYQPGIFLKTNITPTTCIIHEKSVIDEVGYFDESLPVLEDWDLWIRISQKYEFYHIKKVTCEFTWRDDGSTTTSAKIDQFAKYRQRITERYLKKSPLQKEKDQCPLVSIIILTFNALQYTKKCVRSIQQHTVYPYEIIFVDNASTDGTAKYLRKIVRKHDNFSLIENKENKGFAAGNNQGMAVARGDYILLMNNDVVVTPGWLDRMISCAEKSPDIGMVGPVSNYVSGPQLVDDVKYNTSSLAGLNEFAAKRAEKYSGRSRRILRVVGFCMLTKRAVVDKIGGLDSRYGLGNFEDDDFSLRAALAGFGSCIAEDCFIHHFGNRTFIGAKIDYRESLLKNWEIFKEKWGLPKELSYGSPYNVMQISKGGFVPEKHYYPLTGRDFQWKNEFGNTSFDSNSNAAEKIYINEIQPLINEGKHEKATIALEELITLYPKFALAYNDLGVLYFNKGEKEKALSYYEKAVQLQPENITYQKNLADFYYVVLGRVEEAMRIYVKVLNINPEDVETLLIIGHMCVALKKFDDAKDFYSRILIIEPWNKDAKQFLEELEKCQLSVASDRLGSEDIETTPKECLVSAIVSTYNSERFIRGCLEDLENQTIADRLEIIVVNSGSEHNEDKIIKEFQEKYSNIKYIKTYQRETIYQAWNRGVKAATGKYITNANTDDRHRKDAFELLAKVLDENQDVALVYADQIITEKENETLEKYTQAGIFFWPDFDRNYLLKVCSTGSQPMWRKSVHEEFGYFDESMHIAGDYEFWLRITQKYFLKHVPELLGLYYRSSQNAEYRNHQRTMQETALVQSYYKTKLMLNEPQVQGNPLVSVIIPTYNRSQQLETALKSVALQSYENIEAIVINDGGEDVSVVIGKFKGELEIQYITHKQNKDRAAARNTGLKNARGEYIAYLDDDDIFHNDHIETALRVLTNSGFKIVYSDAFRTHQKNIDGNYQIIRKDIPYSTDYQPGIFLKTNITPTTCIIHEKSVIDEVGYFDESLPVLEDWDLWIRISQKYEFYHIKKVTCEFTWRDDGSTTTSAKIDQFAKYRQRITERYLKKSPLQKEKDQCPLVSIIILTFNALQYTKKCVRSIQQHTVYPYEIIFVDNASTDGTAKYLRKIVRKHDNFSLIENKENKGFAAGNNQGMAVARGDYILLMNNDVVVTPGWLDRMISCAEKSPDIGMVGPVSNYVSGPQLVDDVKYNTSSLAGLNEFAAKRAEKYSGRSRRILRVVGFCMLTKRAVVDKIGGLDSRYGLGNFEDDDFSLRAALAGFGSCIAEDCFIHHFGNRTFIGAKIDYRESLLKNWEIFKEKWGLPKELSYGSPYNVMQISKGGFVPEKHYYPLTGRDFQWKNEFGNTSFDSNSNAAEKIYINEIQPLINEGKHEKATIALEELITLYPKFALAYNDLGVLYFNKGEKEKALSYYEKAVQLQPENITYQKNLADFYYVELGRIEDALKLYNKALYINSKDIETLLIIGHICVSLKKFDDAKAFYNKVLDIDPLNEDARQILDKLLNHKHAKNPDIQVSIIIPTTGQEKYIKNCVESIKKHTPQSHAITFVNNGATKGTTKWLKSCLNENSNYQMIKSPKNASFTGIYNQGIKASTGEYILLLSNDVVVTKGWLDGMLECMKRVPDAGIVGPMSNISRGRQQASTVDDISIDQLDKFADSFSANNRYRRISTFSIDGFCMLFRRDLVEEIGLFDEQFGKNGYEDEDFSLRAVMEGHRNIIAGDVYVHQQGKKAFVRNKKYFNAKWNKADAQSPSGKKFLTLTAIEKGCDVYQRGHIDNAVEILLEGIGLSPDDKQPYYALAEILLHAKNHKDAIDILNEMPQNEKDIKRLELLGYCKEGMDNNKEAQDYADRILSLNGNFAQALNLKGILAFKQSDIKSAEDYFNRAIESDPGYGEPYTNLGAILWDRQPEGALDLFEKGFILSPTITDIVTNYHSAVTASGEFDRAGQVFEEACTLYPNNKMIRYQLIDVLIKQEKNAEAMHQIEEAIALYGVDDGVLSAALKIRDMLGPIEIDETKDKKYTVSLCMIVKNEEQYLAKCLRSVKPVVDEMIVADTGSTDRTKEIARAFGVKIYDFKWTDDFSEARNFSISKASGRWTFHLDADEVISSIDYEAFRKIIRQSATKQIAFLINTRNYTMDVNQVEWTANDGKYDKEEAATGWTPSKKVRLFCNESSIRFEYPIHEMVDPSLKRAGITVKECSIPVHHYGKLNKEKSSGKVEVYYQIGRKKLDETGGDAVAIRELAIQAEIIKKHDEAIELWERFIAIEPSVPKAYINMGISYCSLGKFEEVLETAKKAMKLAPNMKEAHYNYALGKLHLGSAAEAVSILEKLLDRLGEYPPAQFLLAAAYCCDGKKEKGINELKELQKSTIGPGLPIRCHELAKGLVSSHRNDYAIMLLEVAIDSKNSNKDVLELYYRCLEMMNIDRKTGTKRFA